MKSEGRKAWIDAAKFIASMAVVIDHTYKYLYVNSDIAVGSRFSVSLFILLSGITAWIQDWKYTQGGVFSNLVHDLRKIIPAYLMASFIFLIVDTHFFDLRTYFLHIIFFDTRMAYYFVLLYIQIMVLNRILFGILRRIPENRCVIYEIVIFAVMAVLSGITTNYSNILNAYGGGGKLFGGTYMILFYIGMLLSKHSVFGQLKKTIHYVPIFVGAGAIWIIYWRLTCLYGNALDQFVPLGNGINPPSLRSSVPWVDENLLLAH